MELPRAGVWRRLAAWLVDIAVGVVVWWLCAAWLILGVWPHPPTKTTW